MLISHVLFELYDQIVAESGAGFRMVARRQIGCTNFRLYFASEGENEC